MTKTRKQHVLLALSIAAVVGAFTFATRFTYGVLGTHDAAWLVRTEAPRETLKTLQRRFSADQRYFDMNVVDGGVRLVADEHYRDLVRARVAWDGGLTARRVDPTFDLPDPRNPAIQVLPADARGGRRWRGTMDALFADLDALPEDPAHALLLVRRRGLGGAGIYETIAVDHDPAWKVGGTLPGAASDEKLEVFPTKDGRGLFLMLPPPAATALAELAAAAKERGDRYALSAGPSTLGTEWATEDRGLVISLGEDVAAYEFAFRNYLRLSSGGLPKNLPIEETRLPLDIGLGALHIALPLLVAGVWFAIARRLDRAAPEPWWLVLLTGAVSLAINPLTLYLRKPIEGIDWLDPQLTDRVGRLEGFGDTLLAFFLHAGIPEELVKLLPVLLVARWRKEFDEPIDGVLYCAASAAGFSCIEEYGYLFYGRMHASLLVLRATSTPPAHIFFTAISGYALGQGIGKGWRAIPIAILGLLGAAFAHALYDTSITFPVLQLVGRALLVALLLVFAYLVRRALRGSKRKVSALPGAVVVRVGNYVVFALMTAGIALATLLARELALRSSPESTYTTGTTIALLIALSAATGAAAFVLVASIPIDAVIDPAGVTFSGVTYAWDEIEGIAYRHRVGRLGRRSTILVRLREKEIRIGPLGDRAAVALYVAIDAHRPQPAPIPAAA
ncbi:MAG: PrsW family intramembrane metalloprotease [Polyangiaceae bacterium]